MEYRIDQVFFESTRSILKEMAGISLERQDQEAEDIKEITSLGVTSIIAFAGKKKGRLVIDMEKELALTIGKNLMMEEYESERDPMVLAAVSELNNTIAGDANTKLNNEHNWSLRLAPPVVMAGKDAIISIPKLPSVTIRGNTSYGSIQMNVAFEGGIE